MNTFTSSNNQSTTKRYIEICKHMNEILRPLSPLDSGDKYETFITELLRAHGFTAYKTGSKDFGVDIVASINKKDYKFIIQCKFYNKTLGNTPVQEVFSGMNHSYKGESLVVITNNYMTVKGKQYAYKLGVEIIARDQWDVYKSVPCY